MQETNDLLRQNVEATHNLLNVMVEFINVQTTRDNVVRLDPDTKDFIHAVIERLQQNLPSMDNPVDTVDRSADVVYIVHDKDKMYRRDTHPLLFKVVDLLQEYPDKRNLSVRELAAETDVGKSWCAVAKRYWQMSSGHSGHVH